MVGSWRLEDLKMKLREPAVFALLVLHSRRGVLKMASGRHCGMRSAMIFTRERPAGIHDGQNSNASGFGFG
jgi:hypothetical protein